MLSTNVVNNLPPGSPSKSLLETYPAEQYHDTINYLFGLQRFGIKLGLETMRLMLRAFGNPHHNFRSVHIAGSNGKGSVAAFVTTILRTAGYRTGLYTSPHLSDFSERIRISGKSIAWDDVVQLTRRIRSKQHEVAADNGLAERSSCVTAMTFFEFTTLMAFLHFVQKQVDLAVVEAGMGGRLDATNVLTPVVSAITTITGEHRQFLGKTLAEIAREKAAILKPDGVVITGATQPQVLAAIRSRAKETRNTMYCLGKDIRVARTGEAIFDYRGIFSFYHQLRISMMGEYQVTNAALAVGIIEILRTCGYDIPGEAVREGLRNTKWPGRMEIVNHQPLVLLDGAHNLDAVKQLAKELKTSLRYRRLCVVIGIMKDKPIRAMLRRIVPLADHVILTRPRLERAASLSALFKVAREFASTMEIVDDVKEAVRKALSWANQDDLVCVTGSLFTVGEARELFYDRVDV
ncbi:MAG: bifunctional folylpolyglutamate synthase/dihydrofolate synthase [Deltaproteobacteria bacterium]|nr:bifunctional folylpolyglutamate synthase/dihydrofolate synthase [Deltaproteobacteria bacterium]